ncbi:MAG: sensor histidine kinase [Anaerolineae bacterium]|nr:sensor histidine kinase [Thermoflexales bacterium]MDW8054073.1 sensor histidine kinase [Anaerolineae bacterium]
MVEALRMFFTTNELIVQFVHGQVFFLLGVMMGVQWVVQRSRLELVRALPWLAAFGVLEAVATWGNTFIPVQAQILPPEIIQNLRFAQLVIYLLNFATLLGFGLRLIEPKVPAWAAVYVPLVIVMVGVAALATTRALVSARDVITNATIEALMRYTLCLPSAALVSYGLQVQASRLVGPLKNERLINVLRIAGYGFIFYALVEGVLVPQAPFVPASVLNTEMLFAQTGIPVGIYRSMAGGVLAWFLFRSLEAFRIEAERQNELLQRQQSLIAERERISRDLHDGTIQSIYAAGLVLDDARHALARLQLSDGAQAALERARAQIETVMQMLSKTNAEIRNYIYDLRASTAGDADLARGLLDIVAEFRMRVAFPVEWRAEGCTGLRLSPEQRQHIYQIAREALSNIARHANATRATVTLACSNRDGAHLLKLEISDNGKGIGSSVSQEGRGLSNMRERAALLGARLDVESALGEGTRVVLTLALTPESV